MLKLLPLIMILGMLSACISGVPKQDTYTSSSGQITIIQSDREACVQSCNDEYSRCMEEDEGHNNGGVNGPPGMFGASADCHNSLKDCLPSCKGR